MRNFPEEKSTSVLNIFFYLNLTVLTLLLNISMLDGREIDCNHGNWPIQSPCSERWGFWWWYQRRTDDRESGHCPRIGCGRLQCLARGLDKINSVCEFTHRSSSIKNAQITESQDFYETLYIMFLYTFRSSIQFHYHVEKHKHVIFL